MIDKEPVNYYRLSITRVDADVYMALGAEDNRRGGRRQMEIVNDALREYLLRSDMWRIQNIPPALDEAISAYAKAAGRTKEQQIIFDLCEAYGVSYE